jgi:hypothetical protein
MIVGTTRRRHGRRSLGVLSVPVNGSLVYANPVSINRDVPVRGVPIRPVGPAYPPGGVIAEVRPITPAWGSNPQQWGPGYSGGSYVSTGYQNPNLPTSQNNLAQLTLLYQSNPSSLTPGQWQQLQTAGVMPATVPYSNAALVNPSGTTAASGIDPNTGMPYASELAAAQAAAAGTSALTTSSSVLGVDPTSGATTIFGIDWYWVAAGGFLVLYLMSGKRR